jgi:hypothetical protein
MWVRYWVSATIFFGAINVLSDVGVLGFLSDSEGRSVLSGVVGAVVGGAVFASVLYWWPGRREPPEAGGDQG